MSRTRRPLRPRPRGLRAGAVLALAGALAGCEGDNLFQDSPTEVGGADRVPPIVSIAFPDSTYRAAVGDSVQMRVAAGDNRALASVQLSGFVLRGTGGVQTRVERFVPSTVRFAPAAAVRDTLLFRYLVATADTAAESPVYLVATAVDAGDNVTADTVRISIGGRASQLVPASSRGGAARP